MKNKNRLRQIIGMTIVAGLLLFSQLAIGQGAVLAADDHGMSMDMSEESQTSSGTDMPGMEPVVPSEDSHQAVDAVSWPVLIAFAAVNGAALLAAAVLKRKKLQAKEVAN